MPVVPVIAGFGAAYFGAGMVAGALSSSLLVGGIVAGAVAGAVVGGIQTAIEGGDILEGVLFGAVGGAVGGAMGGIFSAGSWGAALEVPGATSIEGIGGTLEASAYSSAGTEFMGTEGITSSVLDGAGTAGAAGGAGVGEMGVGTAMMLTQGAQGLLSGFSGGEEEEEGPSYEEQLENARLDAATSQQYALEQIAAGKTDNPALEIAKLQDITNREKISTDAELTREQIASSDAQLASQLQAQKDEYMTAYSKEAEARERAIDSATGLLIQRKPSEGQASTPDTGFTTEQTPEYVG